MFDTLCKVLITVVPVDYWVAGSDDGSVEVNSTVLWYSRRGRPDYKPWCCFLRIYRRSTSNKERTTLLYTNIRGGNELHTKLIESNLILLNSNLSDGTEVGY